MMDGYKHYIRSDEAGIIVHGFSDAFEQPQDGDICIVDDGPRHFHLAWLEPLTSERGQYRFKWDSGKKVERSQQELDSEWTARPIPPDPDAELAAAIRSATTLDELKAALLGNGKSARVKGKMK